MKNELNDRQLNIERTEEIIAALLGKLFSENMITQEDVSKIIDYIYGGEVVF